MDMIVSSSSTAPYTYVTSNLKLYGNEGVDRIDLHQYLKYENNEFCKL
jgi:hypothetical protein